MRSILIAAVVGVLAAVPASYFLTAPARQDRAATLARAGNAVSETVTPAEAWPICSTMASMVETRGLGSARSGFRGRQASDRRRRLGRRRSRRSRSAGLRDARNADIQNYLGYAYRRLRQFDPAMQHYRQALTLNPRHRSAHEHLGEAYLVQGDLAKAKEQLAALERICLIPCDEYDDLKRAIAEYNKVARR